MKAVNSSTAATPVTGQSRVEITQLPSVALMYSNVKVSDVGQMALIAALLAGAAGFSTFEDDIAKTTYGSSCAHTPPEGPRGASGLGYGFTPAYPLWDAKCFNKNCARENGNRDGGKTGGWTKNNKQCNNVGYKMVDLPGVGPKMVDHPTTVFEFGYKMNVQDCNGPDRWMIQEMCLSWCVAHATIRYGSGNHPDPQFCCQLELDKAGRRNTCAISLDGSPGFKTPSSKVYTAIQVFSTSCSAEYADPAACAAD